MRYFFRSKTDAVGYVTEELSRLNNGSALTMTIEQVSSEGYFVRSVIDASSEDIAALLGKFYLERLYST